MNAPPGTDGTYQQSSEVAQAQRDGTPIVALESTIIAHGLPRPRNLDVARELEAIVRDQGACPATIAVLDGVAHIGLESDELARVAGSTELRKLGRRDLPVAMALEAASGFLRPAASAACTGASSSPLTSRPISTC
jgi:pseudouridine-5'-phosphate glycosidase